MGYNTNMVHKVTLDDIEWFFLLELKGRYRQKGLYGLLLILDELAQKNNPDKNTNISSKKISYIDICVCGHTERNHEINLGCTVHGCKCPGFTIALEK